MEIVTIYTDGSCLQNPGVGGWACVLIHGSNYKEICGAEIYTTNNRMELQAVIQGLTALKKPCTVKVYSDSAYVINAFNQKWIDKWQTNNWVNSQHKPVLNSDLWQQLSAIKSKHQVEFIKVKGHADNEYNNRCDELARQSATNLK